MSVIEIKPIRTENDYEEALLEVAALIDEDPAPGTPDFDRLDVMATLIVAYEAEHYPIESPLPVEAIKFTMEQQGLVVKDLVPFIGSPNRVYEVLNGKRDLSLRMIRRLHEGLGIPTAILVGRM